MHRNWLGWGGFCLPFVGGDDDEEGVRGQGRTPAEGEGLPSL